ncbi:MAG TPA: ABC transporter permease [Gemmatimonadales bacterium]|nr:ABC transporter permease [Gemmatimonadales bacterium]
MHFESLRADTVYALRGFRARPGLVSVIVLVFALGLGANATMFGVLDRLLLRAPDHVTDPDRVYGVGTHTIGEPWTQSTFSYADYADFRDNVPGFVDVAAATMAVTNQRQNFPLGRGASADRVAGELVSWNFFRTLGVRPALGRFFLPGDDSTGADRAAVIGYGFWRRHFGGRADAIGRQIEIGKYRYTVVGVAPKGFTGVELPEEDVWLPVHVADGLRFDATSQWDKSRTSQWLRIVGRLRPGVSAAQARDQATSVYRGMEEQRIAQHPDWSRWIHPDSEVAVMPSIIPSKAVSDADSDVKIAVLLSAMAVVVLIIACANVANLLLVRALARRREVAVRLALGVSRGRLISQLLVEGVMLAGMGEAGALIIALWGSRAIRSLLLGDAAWVGSGIDWRVFGFTTVVAVATGLVTALVPALQAARTDLNSGLKQGRADTGGGRFGARSILLATQAALALVLLAGAGLFVRSLQNVANLPFGVDVDRVLVAQMSAGSVGLSPEQSRRLFLAFADRARAVPGVTDAAVSLGVPFGLSWGLSINVPGKPRPGLQREPVQYAVTPGYFGTLGISLLEGREFTDADRDGTLPVAMINKTAADVYWPGDNPIGQCAKLGSDSAPCTTIVGVVSNTRRQQLVEGLVPQVYRPLAQRTDSGTNRTAAFFGWTLVVRGGAEAARLAEPIRRALQGTDPDVPYVTVRTMADVVGVQTTAWRLGAGVFSAFGALALLLAAIGLYSVLSFGVAQRFREFGVRLALGAQAPDLMRQTMAKGLAPVIAGLGAGVFLAALSAKLVASLLFGVSPRDPGVLGAVSGILLLVAAAAAVVPAWRATRVDPASALRSE